MKKSWKEQEHSSRPSRLMFGTGTTPPRAPTGFANPLHDSLKRLLLLKIIILLFFLVVGARLVQIQLVDSPTYQELARKQYEAKVVIPATRGNIYDRNGKILVSNAMYVSFAADPKMIGKDAPAIAKRFAQVFGKPASTYLEKLATPDKHFVWLERRVKPEIAASIDPNDFEGVIRLNEPKRVYHYGYVGGQLIGFTDVDNNGLSGIELEFDQHLSGKNGYVVMQRDGLGRKRPSVDYPRVEPVNGNSVVLTIDLDYQSIAEEELRKGVDRNKAESGLIIMMDPVNGEILAMANYPTIDPNNISRTGQLAMKNRAVADMFEPGSVFKVVTASAALERHLVKPEQKFSAEQGTYVVNLPGGKKRIITDTHENTVLTFQEAMENSSNIVMAKVSDVIGAEVFYTMARNFGFGIATGVDIPGEVGGELKKPNTWSGITLNSMAYGYEVGVTPMQIAAAYAAVANKGVLMKPYVLKQVVDEHNEIVFEARQQVVRRVISKATAETLTRFFVGVVDRGTGVSARIPTISIAGKTGTSRKFVAGKYEMGSYTASFVGYFPVENPRAVCLVMLDNPRAGGYTGGYASAPIFREITEKVVTTSGRFTESTTTATARAETHVVPDVTNLYPEVAAAMLSSQGFEVETRGNGKVVLRQSPGPGERNVPGARVRLITEDAHAVSPPGYTVVPSLKGLGIRRAINRLTMQQLDAVVEGSGTVVAQSQVPGQQVKIGSCVAVRCEPKSLAAVALY